MKRSLSLLLLLSTGCQRDLSDERLIEMSLAAERAALTAPSAAHAGPAVSISKDGPARFATQVFAAFSSERAFATAALADRFYREPANDGFEAVVDHLVEELRAVGFGAGEALTLEVVETPLESPAWTPVSARLELVSAASTRVLHAFSSTEDRDRVMLPRNAPSAHVEGRLVTEPDAVEAGCVLLVAEPLRRKLLESALARGAVLVLASELADYNVDPKPGGTRHRDAIGYRHVAHPAVLPVAQISPRSAEALRAALAVDPVTRVRFDCKVNFTERPLRTVIATVVGTSQAAECVALAAHIQEPGACDNASGVGTLLEAACVTARLLEHGDIQRPARSVCFIFGNEMQQSSIFLDHTTRRCIAAIAVDMTGESTTETGAVALLERAPDPGALHVLPPDQHTAWSRGDGPTAKAEDLVPNGLALIARCALVDIGLMQSEWKTDDHPYEGGSDHSVFIARGIPAVLFWHFTDFAYHTSLDRLEHVDANEMKRMGSALLVTALAIADPKSTDLQRYLHSLGREASVRAGAARAAELPESELAWQSWTTGARLWLRDLCLSETVVNPNTRNDSR